jgi:hypothetical protein
MNNPLTILEQSWNNLGTILEQSWNNLGTIFNNPGILLEIPKDP